MIRVNMSTLRAMVSESGHPWFSADTMRFFRSRVGQSAYAVDSGRVNHYFDPGYQVVYFVSSEQFRGMDGTQRPRRFTVRKATLSFPTPETCAWHISTVGEFQEFASRSGATARAKYLAQNGGDESNS